MLKELLENERQYLNYFFDALDQKAANQMLQILHECQGVIFFSGVGKSGFVAKKIAATMTSTGTRALFLSPLNALHGDIGILTNQDIFVILSKSGESDELLQLIPFLRNKGAKLISVVSNPNSRIAKACDFSITLPLEKELCPFDMAPTTSMVIQMIYGDLLAIALMRMKNFGLDQYALNHPSGRIGKRITMKVKDLMLGLSYTPFCNPADKVVDTLVELSDKRCGCVLVIDHQHILQGVFTDGDLRRALLNEGPKALDLPIQQLMNQNPKWIGPGELAWEAMKRMESSHKQEVTFLPVLEQNKQVLGLIKLHDIVQSGL